MLANIARYRLSWHRYVPLHSIAFTASVTTLSPTLILHRSPGSQCLQPQPSLHKFHLTTERACLGAAGIRSSIYGPLAVLFPFTAGLVKRLASVFPDPPLANVLKVRA